MNDNRLHIVSFDIPYPATYGGAIDVFYRIKALHDLGVKIILHCTYKGELKHYEELESICEKVYYYPRTMSIVSILQHKVPIAVAGRPNNKILENLITDNSPILYEGLMSCGTMSDDRLANRKKYFRECNVEHDYYKGLAQASKSLSKIYYIIESRRLKRFEMILNHATAIFSLAHQDEKHFKNRFPDVPTIYLPCFSSNSITALPQGTGKGILYHGNLNVAENSLAVDYIIHRIATKMPDIQFTIAGRCNSSKLKRQIERYPNVRLIPNPNEETMLQLIERSQIHLLITFQNTGLKLKLLNVLFKGRHVVCNKAMIGGTELADLCHIEDDAKEIIRLCRSLYNQPLTGRDIEQRNSILAGFGNQHLGKTLFNSINFN